MPGPTSGLWRRALQPYEPRNTGYTPTAALGIRALSRTAQIQYALKLILEVRDYPSAGEQLDGRLVPCYYRSKTACCDIFATCEDLTSLPE